ncbi:MAG: aminotransferase [Desulfurococcales archaeon ex4484_58]|nr:MAG: aminotransferase [Desulfurococcales archaeon ex4484_58]
MNSYEKFLSSLAKNIKASEIRELLAVIRTKKDVISLAGGLPDPQTFPKEIIAKMAEKVVAEYGDYSLQYSETKGIYEVRETLAKFLKDIRGFETSPDDLLITTGSQQALYLISRTLIDPGDVVITENPSYLAALGAFKMCGANIVGVKIDEHGMKTDLLEETVKRLVSEGKKIKFIYVIPVSQNPAGTTMSSERKKHLIEIANKYDLLVLEDDPYSYFVYEEGVDVTAIKALDTEDRVIYISTISKILAPGLRIGWIASPKHLSRKLELVKQYLDLHSPTLNQYILAEILKTSLIKEHVRKLAPFYKVKRDTMLKAIEEYFPDDIWYTKPIGGLFVFVYVNVPGFNAVKLLNTAVEKYKVAYVPGKSFHTDGSGENSMRLNFSYPPPEMIEEGIRRLGELIKNKG